MIEFWQGVTIGYFLGMVIMAITFYITGAF